MKYRLLLALVGASWLLSACASAAGGDYTCRPPAYCGSGKTYNNHGQG